MNQTIDNTNDERTVNNLMRRQYRVLSDDKQHQIQALKDKGLEFVELLHDAGQTSRELSIAQTKIEEAVMWAVKHITR